MYGHTYRSGDFGWKVAHSSKFVSGAHLAEATPEDRIDAFSQANDQRRRQHCNTHVQQLQRPHFFCTCPFDSVPMKPSRSLVYKGNHVIFTNKSPILSPCGNSLPLVRTGGTFRLAARLLSDPSSCASAFPIAAESCPVPFLSEVQPPSRKDTDTFVTLATWRLGVPLPCRIDLLMHCTEMNCLILRVPL